MILLIYIFRVAILALPKVRQINLFIYKYEKLGLESNEFVYTNSPRKSS